MKTNPLRAAAVLRAGWGGALLLMPETLLRIGGRPVPPSSAVVLARVLGARQIVQAVVTAARPSPRVAALSCAVDATHALTDLWLAAASPRWRHVAIDAVIAAGLSAAGAAARRRVL